MDYNDNDYQSHLAGEDNSKGSSVLHPYALPKFDFDDSLQGHLRFDSLVENEVFLGIPTQEDNHWIEDFSRGSSGIEFSSSATDSCSIPRRNNVWSEATSTESVEMLLKSVGQEEMVPGDTIIEESDAGNELGCLIQPAESSLKLDDKRDDVKDSSSAAPADESGEFIGSFSRRERTKKEGTHIVCAPERKVMESIADGFSDIAGERCSGVNTDEKLQTELTSVDENSGEAKTLQNESLPDNSYRQPPIPVIQSAINECLTGSLTASVEILASQHNSTNCHSGNTSGLPSEHPKPGEKQISVSKESSMADEKLRGCAVESETCTSNARPPSLAASKLEVVKELPIETRMINEEPCVQRNEYSLTTEGCKGDTSSVEPAETGFSKGLKDNLLAEGNSILCEVEEASASQKTFETRDTENQEGSSKGQTEKVSAMQMSDGLTTSTEKEENNLDSHSPLNIVTSEAITASEISELSKQNSGNGIYSLEGPSNIQEASVSAELVERPVPENLETGNDADRVSKGYACAGDHVSLSVPAGSMDICGESFSHVVDVDTSADVSGGKEKEELLPVENEMDRSCVGDHGVRSSSVEGESEQISDQGHGSQFESSTLNIQASDVGFDGRNLILGGDSVSVPLLSGSGAIATEIVDHDEKLKPVSVMGGSDHFARKEELQIVLSAEAEVSTLKESSEGAGQLDSLSGDGKDASGDCHMEIKPMVVDQNVLVQDNPDTASHIEQEANIECCKHVEVCATNSGSFNKEGAGVGAGTEAAPLEKNQEMKVETVKLVEVGVKGSSDVICGLKHDSAAVLSCTALSLSEKKTTKSRSRAVVKNVAPLVDTTEIGGKAQPTSINSGENASTKADRSFTFDVSPLAANSKGEADKSITRTQACQPTELKAGDRLHLTSGSKQTDTKIMQEISHASPLVPDKGTPSGGAKGDRKARRGLGKSGKENPRKGSQMKEISSSKQSDRGDKSCVQFSPSVAVQKMQFEAGTVECSITKSSGVVPFPTSNLPDLNTSSPASVLFHQPFTDLQQVQLRAQIFVYGSLIQGTAPDEACMVSAFGTSDGGRSLWDPAWRACVERIHGQRSRAGNNETPSHPRSGPRTPDQANKQVVHQNKVATSAAGRAGGKATNSPAVSPMIPLSSPLWNMPTPSRDGLSSARGAVIDYKTLSSVHPYQTPPARTFVGHTASWLPQSPFPGPWVASPQNSAFDISAQLPALPVTESVKLTPVKESSSSISAGAKHAPPGSVAHAGDSGILSGASLHDNKAASVLPAQYSVDQKSRKRKKASDTGDRAQKPKLGTSSESVTAPVICPQLSNKAPASVDFGQLSSVAVAPLVAHTQTGPTSVPIIGGHFSTSVVIAPPSSSVPKNNSDIPITSAPSSTDLSKRKLDLGKKTPSSEYSSKVEDAKLQAEDAAANAAAAVSNCQDVWSRLDKHKNSDLALDIEFKLTSAAAAVAAATSVAKAAAAAAKLASNAALQAKLMADEAMMAYGVSNPSQTNATSFPNIVNNLGSATPASVLKSQDAGNGSSSIIFAAREASRRRIEAASTASRHAENLDDIVKAAELAAEAVSHAGKVVALTDPLCLTQLVEAGPDSYWKAYETLSGQGVKANKVNEDESGIPIVEKTPGIFSKRSEGPSVEEMHPAIPACQPTSVSGNIIEESMRNEEVIQTPVTGVEKDVRGAKGHSMPEVSKTVGLVSESSHDLVEACGNVASSRMQEGSLVEVFKDSDDGKRAWYSAKVLTLKNGKALVCYTDHQSDEGLEQLKDWVPLDAGSDEPPRIRPAHPVTALQGEKKRRRAAVKEYTWYVGDRVDAWIDYRWREGVIAEKNKRDETTFSVNFPAYGDTAVVRAWHLRPNLVWKDGEWVEWSRSRHDFLSQGDTPKEKRVKLGNRASEDTGNDGLSKKMDLLVPVTNEPATLLPLSVNEKTFNIGSNKDDNKPNTHRTMRSGLQKEGSKVFGVPKPGKKRKFMEVSKHYVSDRATKSNAAHGSAKFTKYLMPQATGTGGWKTNSRTDLKEKQAIEARRKLPKPSKPPSSSRNLKDNSITSTGDASGADHTVGDAIEYDKHEAQQPNVVNFVSNAEERTEGPMKFRSEALPTNIPKKASTSSNRGEGMKKKIPVSNLKSSKVEVKDKMIPEVNEPRRSNRRIQPTSRLLEGLQSSLIISKLPSVSHDKSSRSHSRGASR